MILARPLQELDLGDEDRFQPPAILHLRRRQARTPSPALRFREIHERAILELQPAEFLEELLPDGRREAVAGACGVDQTVALVVTDNERVERLRPGRVAADHEFLAAVDPHLLPGARPQAGFVPAVQALRDQPFKALRLHGCDEHRQRGIERRRISDWFGELREDLLLQQLAPGLQRLLPHVAAGQDHHIEHEVQHRRLRGAVVLQDVE